MQALFEITLPVFLIVGFGYFATWRGWFLQSHVTGLMTFIRDFAIPCLLFRAIATLDLAEGFDPRIMASFYLGALVGFTVAFAGARWLFKRDWEDSIVIGFIGLFSNSVMLGLPITERAYGAEALTANYALVSIHAPFCYAIGITAMEITRARGKNVAQMTGRVMKAMFSNALILGIVLGFAVNLSGLNMPSTVMAAVDMMARAAIPAALFGVGGVLCQYRPEGSLPTVAFVGAVSILIHPTVSYGMATALDVSKEALRSIVLTASMAPGINVYLFASMYGRAERVAATTVLLATAVSILTITFWLNLLP